MNLETLTTQNFIKVIPQNLFPDEGSDISLQISKLCYWCDGEAEHPVNDVTVGVFLKYANLYDVFVYPEQPELGCYAIDGDIQPEKGEINVHEIYYKGNLIYRDC